MALDPADYTPVLKYGGQISGSEIINSTIATANVANGAITAAKTSMLIGYETIAVGTTGPTQVNVFGAATAPVSGTVTGYWLVTDTATGGSAGTITLWGTTAGTIATIANTGTTTSLIGLSRGTSILNAAVVAGDALYVKGIGAGTSTAFITFISPN